MDRPLSVRAILDAIRHNPVVALGVLAAVGLFGFVIGAGFAARGPDAEATTGPNPTPSPVLIRAANASCQAPDSKDSVGRKVTYEAALAIDDNPETAWRCRGNGRDERLALELSRKSRVVEVGILPGYAKTDAADGTDRYAENRRLTKIRWVFDSGVSVVQELDPDPGKRDLQTMQIDPVETQTVAIEILDSSDAKLDRVAVSTVRLSGFEP